MGDTLVSVDDLTAIQIASICDHSILETYTSFRGKGEDPRALREQNLLDFFGRDDTKRPCPVCNLRTSGMRLDSR